MRIDVKPVLISILMIVFDLSTGVGAQIQNFEVENIPEIDDFSLKEDSWSSGYNGIMQIILLANMSSALKKNIKR